MSRGGRETLNEEPERRCIVSGDVAPKAGLVRFVVGPEATIYPDLAEKLPGRGIWVTADADLIAQAIKKNLFARSAKMQVKVPENLLSMVEEGLAHRVVELISLARKSGYAVAGFEKVKGWLADGKAKVLLQASDGSDRGKGKLWTPPGGRWFGCLTSSELGLAFARDHAIHGALAAGGLADGVIREAARLAGLRKRDGGETALKDSKTA